MNYNYIHNADVKTIMVAMMYSISQLHTCGGCMESQTSTYVPQGVLCVVCRWNMATMMYNDLQYIHTVHVADVWNQKQVNTYHKVYYVLSVGGIWLYRYVMNYNVIHYLWLMYGIKNKYIRIRRCIMC